MKMRDLVASIVILLFISSCDCNQDPSPSNSWVICVGDKPMLTNGHDQFLTGPNFNPQDWSCPKPASSPIWQGSGRPTYRNFPVPGATAQGLKRSAGGSSAVAYLPPALLDLPFLARPSSSDNINPPCDSSFPDVIQVNHDNSSVNRISTCPFQARAMIPVVSRPLQIAITPDGLTALVTSFDNAVNFVDLASNRVTFTLKTTFDVNPHGIAISPDGTRAYITSFNPDNPVVQVIDLNSRTVLTSILVAAYPQSVFITPDGSQLYVTFPFSNAIYVIDTLTNTVANTLAISAPRGLAFNSKGTKAYVSSASGSPGTIQQINTNTFHVDNIYKVGLGPTDVAVLYGDRYVVVNNFEGQSVSMIDANTGIVQTNSVGGSPVGISIVR